MDGDLAQPFTAFFSYKSEFWLEPRSPLRGRAGDVVYSPAMRTTAFTLGAMLSIAACAETPLPPPEAAPKRASPALARASLDAGAPDGTRVAVAAPLSRAEPPPVGDAADSPPPALTLIAARARVNVRREPTRLKSGGTLAGPCVLPGLATTVDRYATSGTDAEPYPDDLEINAADESEADDLDGDGTADTLVFIGGARTLSTFGLYVRRGECGYFVGSIETENGLHALATKSHGLADVRTVSDQCGPLKTRFCEVFQRFDGHTYRLLSRKPLPFPSPTLSPIKPTPRL